MNPSSKISDIFVEIQNPLSSYRLRYQDKYVGTCHICLDNLDSSRKTIEITNLRIHSNYRGKGYGSFLLRTVLEICKNNGYTHATLSDESENKGKPNNIYLKCGFKETGSYYLRADLSNIHDLLPERA